MFSFMVKGSEDQQTCVYYDSSEERMIGVLCFLVILLQIKDYIMQFLTKPE